MKEISGNVTYRGKDYKLVFNFNVMEAIQAEYGTIEHWGELTDGETREPDAKAIIFGFREMLNEGIDIANEENGTETPFLTSRQVGRMIGEIGFDEASGILTQTIVDSTESTEKNV